MRRTFRVEGSFDEEEHKLICAAADAAGMKPGAYLAQTATDAARAAAAGQPPAGGRLAAGRVAGFAAAMDAAVAEAKAEGNIFKQAVRMLHITGQRSPELERHAAELSHRSRRMEAATLRVARELLR
jgi:hypothetical protein